MVVVCLVVCIQKVQGRARSKRSGFCYFSYFQFIKLGSSKEHFLGIASQMTQKYILEIIFMEQVAWLSVKLKRCTLVCCKASCIGVTFR
uniref:Putative secreted protein n=1 Tax=Ixodes ricinus TaxID=34613 RepID=A0A6B0UCC5_IXORI